MEKLDLYTGIAALTSKLRCQLSDFSVDHVSLDRDAATMAVLLLDELDRLIDSDRRDATRVKCDD